MNGNVRSWTRPGLIAGALVIMVGGAAVGATIASGGAAAPAAAVTHGGTGSAPDCASAAKVTVTGNGTVSITPNLLTLGLDVHTTAPEASTALSKNDTVTAAVLKALSSGGIASQDLQTTDLTVEPNYADTGGTVIGYGVDNTVVAKIRKFATAGTLVDAAVAAGGDGTRIDSMAFSLTRPLRAQARARNDAVRQAVSHAHAIAASAGEKVIGICSIHDETSTSTTSPVVPRATFGAVNAPAGAPVESGSETVTARVRIVFAIR